MSRDEQFKLWAKSVMDKFNQHVAMGECVSPEQGLARAGYDLVKHAIYCNGIHSDLWPGGERYGQASDIYLREVDKHTDAIPDMSELPEGEE